MIKIRRTFRIVISACVLVMGAVGFGADSSLIFAGPPEGILSLPVLRMMETSAGASVKFIPWNTPDQLRSLVAGNKADVVACHTHVAANLANRGAQVRMMNITLWKLMWVVTSDATVTSGGVKTLFGKEIAIPMRGDLTDVILSAAIKKSGVEFKPIYVKSSLDAAQWLLNGRVSSAVLPEPIVSNTLLRGVDNGLSLRRGLDVQELWGEAFGVTPRLPLAGIAAVGTRVDDARLAQFAADYAEAAKWCVEHPEEAAKLPSRQSGGNNLAVPGIARALDFTPPQPEAVTKNRGEIDTYFKELMTQNPALIGGKLPDAGFYFQTPDAGQGQNQ